MPLKPQKRTWPASSSRHFRSSRRRSVSSVAVIIVGPKSRGFRFGRARAVDRRRLRRAAQVRRAQQLAHVSRGGAGPRVPRLPAPALGRLAALRRGSPPGACRRPARRAGAPRRAGPRRSIEVLRTNEGVAASPEELRELAARLPPRTTGALKARRRSRPSACPTTWSAARCPSNSRRGLASCATRCTRRARACLPRRADPAPALRKRLHRGAYRSDPAWRPSRSIGASGACCTTCASVSRRAASAAATSTMRWASRPGTTTMTMKTTMKTTMMRTTTNPGGVTRKACRGPSHNMHDVWCA